MHMCRNEIIREIVDAETPQSPEVGVKKKKREQKKDKEDIRYEYMMGSTCSRRGQEEVQKEQACSLEVTVTTDT